VSDNQRVLDLAAEIRRVDGNHTLGAAALAESLEPWIDAVVAEVRSDLLNEVTPYYRQEYWVNKGRQAAARDIRADTYFGGDQFGDWAQEHAARIAEAAPSPK
jgi:hypothetical protein